MTIQDSPAGTATVSSLKMIELLVQDMDGNGSPKRALTGTFTARCTAYRARVGDDVSKTHFFGIQNDFVLDPEALLSDTAMDRSWYVKQYRIRIEPIGLNEDSGAIGLDSSPKNASGTVDITIGTSFSFGASGGVFGDVPTFNVDANRGSSTSRSYRVEDMTVVNHHQRSYAEWMFTTPVPGKIERDDTSKEDNEDYALEPLKPLQINDFQPTVVAAWQARELPDGFFVVRTTLEATFARSRLIGHRWGRIGQFFSGLTHPIGTAIREHSEAKREVVTETRSASQTFDVAIRCAN